MAVDPREFAALDPSVGDGVRRRLGLGSDRILLAPSRLSRQKGPDLLLDAALPLLDSGWRLVFAGPVNEEDFVESVRRRAVAAGGKVVFTQLSRQELLALMVESEIVCLPSRGETAGGVALEGMYAGALVVVSDAVEAARDDYLAGQEAGLLFPSEDLSALRAALARGMHEDHSARRRAARILVEERFTWSRSVDRLLSLYEEARA